MDAGRHEPPRSETKDFIINAIARSMSIGMFSSLPVAPCSHMGDVMDQITLQIQWICIAAEEPRAKGTIILKQAARYPVPLSDGPIVTQ